METDHIQLKELESPSNGSLSDYQSSTEGEEHHRVSASVASKLRIAAVVVSWCSVIFSASTGVAALVLGTIDKSEALFGYGLDATLDGVSSVAVLWRFYGSASDLYSEKKERKACFVIGWLFILSGLLLTGKSLFSIITRIHETKISLCGIRADCFLPRERAWPQYGATHFGLTCVNKAIILYTTFALTTGVVSVILAFIKVYLGYKLESVAMGTDSIITFVGAAMSFLGVAGLELYVQDTRFWYMDSVFGIICGLFLVIFGVRVLYGVWRMRKKDGHTELQ